MTTLIERGSFAGHETFPFRYTWMRKASEFVQKEPSAFGREDAMVELGVGKNMVRSMRHWALVAGMLEEAPGISNNRGSVLRPTELARSLLVDDGWDPYLEDPATLWLLHWQIASTPDQATTWYWAFNHLPQPEFSKTDLQRWLMQLVADGGWSRISPASMKRDIDCFVRTYVAGRTSRGFGLDDTLDCPLIELGLLRELDARGTFILNRGEQPTLPDAVLAYALGEFLKRRFDDGARTIPIDAVAFAPGSPGRVFCITEDALLLRLERLDQVTGGALVFDETAGLRQVLVKKALDPQSVLKSHYQNGASSRKRA